MIARQEVHKIHVEHEKSIGDIYVHVIFFEQNQETPPV